MTKKFWNSDKILSISAMLISLLTLIVFLYQTNLIRKQQYMSVLPYLEMGNNGTNTNNYKFVVKNNGIGPAILKSVKVTAASGKIYTDIIDYVEANLSLKDTLGYYHSNLSAGMLLPEKEAIYPISVYDKKINSGKRLYAILNADSLKIEIEYASIYGERWVIENGANSPKKL